MRFSKPSIAPIIQFVCLVLVSISGIVRFALAQEYWWLFLYVVCLIASLVILCFAIRDYIQKKTIVKAVNHLFDIPVNEEEIKK